jgi:hypothetical protein
MTGEEHYATAERLVDTGFRSARAQCMSPETRNQYLAAAQVHATLAAAAAGLLAAGGRVEEAPEYPDYNPEDCEVCARLESGG